MWFLLAIALPNLTATPGAVRNLTQATICSTKWGLDERHVTTPMRRRIMVLYNIKWSDHSLYVFDHLIPRSLGGADEVANVWPQPKAESHAKDTIERRLSRAVCVQHTMTLEDAQAAARKWGRP